MTTKWNALALGLAATVIFSGGETQAQGVGDNGVTPAEIRVSLNEGSFIFSSNALVDSMDVCEFEFRLRILDTGFGLFPSIGDFGEVVDGSLEVDQNELLAALGTREAHFSLFCTSCGSNTGDYGAQALRANLQRLDNGESVTLHTLYFDSPICEDDVCCGP